MPRPCDCGGWPAHDLHHHLEHVATHGHYQSPELVRIGHENDALRAQLAAALDITSPQGVPLTRAERDANTIASITAGRAENLRRAQAAETECARLGDFALDQEGMRRQAEAALARVEALVPDARTGWLFPDEIRAALTPPAAEVAVTDPLALDWFNNVAFSIEPHPYRHIGHPDLIGGSCGDCGQLSSHPAHATPPTDPPAAGDHGATP